jgi:hypothetical protein
MWQTSEKSEAKFRKIFSFISTIVLLLGILVIVIPPSSPSVTASVHGVSGASSTMDENGGPNDADPSPTSVRWAVGSNHYIEGNYTVSLGISLTIDPGCNILFNGSYSIFVLSTLFAQGTSGNQISFTSNSTVPGPGNWSSLDFASGGGFVEYCNIQYADEAISLDTTQTVTIENNVITDNVIGVGGTIPTLSIRNNNISNNSMQGINLNGPSQGLSITIIDNIITNNQGGFGGIEIYSPQGDITATITGNEIGVNLENGIYIEAFVGDITATINDNEIYGHGNEGIYVFADGDTSTINATILYNNITGNRWGILLANTEWSPDASINYNISNNNISFNGDGIYVTNGGSTKGNIWRNVITNNWDWPAILNEVTDGEGQIRIIDNIIKDNFDGIWLEYSYSIPAARELTVEFTDNIVLNNSDSGIYISSDEFLNVTMERNQVNENFYGLILQSFENLKAALHNNTFNTNNDNGISIYAFETVSLVMSDNEVKENFLDNFYLYTFNNGDIEIYNNDLSGSQKSNGMYFDYFKGQGILKDNIISANGISGIDFWECNDITVLNSTLANNLYGITAYQTIADIVNSSIINSTLYDFSLHGITLMTSLNTSFDNSTANFDDSKANLSVQWYLDVNVIDTSGLTVDDAWIYVNDTYGTTEWSGSTGVGNSGWVYFIPSTEYVQNLSTKNFTTPHNISAQKGPERGFAYPNIWKNRNVTVVINSIPLVEDIMPAGGAPQIVYRDNMLMILANSTDFKDPEDLLVPYFEYNDSNGFSWNSTYFGSPTYIGSAPSGFWAISFSPPMGAPVGWYDFRVRFADTAGAFGDYLYANSSVYVGNNVPIVIDLTKERDTVYRTQSIFVYVNGSDIEDPEGDLTPQFQYNDPDDSGWTDGYLSNPIYNNNRWEVIFTPPSDAKPGVYDFRVRFMDSHGNLSLWLSAGNFVEVLNNPPESIDLTFSVSSVYRTQMMYVYAKGFDVEDIEQNIMPHFESKASGETLWTDMYLFNPLFVIDKWRVEFIPASNSALGTYDFRMRFNDSALDFSGWIYNNGTITVNNNLPVAFDIQSTFTQVTRGNGAYIFANGTDSENGEQNLRCEFSYRILGGSSWENSSFSQKTYTGVEWRITFTPVSDLPTGDYEFQIQFYDLDSDVSNIIVLSHVIRVLNNLPTVDSIDVSSSQIYRTESVIVYAKGGDFEDIPSDITPTFQYKPSDSSQWNIISGWSYDSAKDRFEVSFTPTATSELGDYDFRVKFTDSDDDESGFMNLDGELEVLNNVPSVLDITISATEIFRGEEVILYANAQDNDLDESDLIPTFEYTTTQGAWQTLYLASPQYIGEQWQVVFSPPQDAADGNYMFQVKFSDSMDDSNFMLTTSSLNVKNNLPSVEIETSGSQGTDTVSFSAVVSDSEDSLPNLVFEWEFGNGEKSSERNPIFTYSKSGSYTVTLTVTDSDDGVTIDTSEIQVEGGTGPGSSQSISDTFPLWILMVLVLVIVVILVLVLLLKKKKPEEEIEAWQPESQSVSPTQPQLAQVPPPPSQVVHQPSVPPPPIIQAPIPQTVVQPKIAPPPPAKASPPPPPASIDQTVSKSIKCPKCHKTFTVDLKKGPNSITCPHCQTKGKINL